MPSENCVGRDNGGDITKAAPAQLVSAYRQPTAFLIGQADPTAHVLGKDAILLDKVGHCVLVPSVEPTGQRCEQDTKRHRVSHGARVYTTDRLFRALKALAEQ
jgi:hypothetical protein